MNKSDDISLLAAAFVKAQTMVESAKKDSVNPFFKSKYADLASVWDAVRTALEENELAVSQLADGAPDGSPALTTMLIHSSGQWISSLYPLLVQKADAQNYGSAISYARRYALAALMGVLSEDDDGEAATRQPKPQGDKHPSANVYAPVPGELASGKQAAVATQPLPPQNHTLTPQAWAEMGLSRVEGFQSLKDLDAFEKKFAARIVQIAPLVPDLHAKLIAAMADKRFVLEAQG